jgi:predicted nucleic acid-binding protein
MLVVADTSPLNYLVLIEVESILPDVFGSVVIPREVLDELTAHDAPPVVQRWARAVPSWVEVRDVDANVRDDPRWAGLDLGERAAIALATTLPPSVLLIDERAGSGVAHHLGLRVTGTLGVLEEAARRRLISLPDAIRRLSSTSFRYPKSLVARLLAEDSARQ